MSTTSTSHPGFLYCDESDISILLNRLITLHARCTPTHLSFAHECLRALTSDELEVLCQKLWDMPLEPRERYNILLWLMHINHLSTADLEAQNNGYVVTNTAAFDLDYVREMWSQKLDSLHTPDFRRGVRIQFAERMLRDHVRRLGSEQDKYREPDLSTQVKRGGAGYGAGTIKRAREIFIGIHGRLGGSDLTWRLTPAQQWTDLMGRMESVTVVATGVKFVQLRYERLKDWNVRALCILKGGKWWKVPMASGSVTGTAARRVKGGRVAKTVHRGR
jgi:hypothetical protein